MKCIFIKVLIPKFQVTLKSEKLCPQIIEKKMKCVFIKTLIPKCAMTAACLSVRFACPAWCNHPESYYNEAQ